MEAWSEASSSRGALRTLFCALLAVLIGWLAGCSGSPEEDTATRAAPVRTVRAERGDMSRIAQAVGNVEASASVSITPRVDGEIIAVNFTEGENVLAGESILEIDPRPYQADLHQKQANLDRSRAQLEKARKDRARFSRLVKDGYISQEAFEQSATDESVLAATVEADMAAVNRAGLELSYCSITAPISGRIGELRLHKGNTVKGNDTGPVCSIDTIAPCYVSFSVPEIHLPVILDHLGRGEVKITATPTGGSPAEGRLTLVGNEVDTRTGTIRLRGTFENSDKRLWPGQFAEIRLPLGDIKDAILIPSHAIQSGRENKFVYVIDKDNKAQSREVQIKLERDGISAVAGEIAPGEKVIVEGMVRITPGSPVRELN